MFPIWGKSWFSSRERIFFWWLSVHAVRFLLNQSRATASKVKAAAFSSMAA
nr:hypothetical protein [Bilophila wadsworthia]